MNPSHHETGLSAQLENMSPTSTVTEVVFATPKGPAPKRRGRPPKNAKVTKDENLNETENEDSSVLSTSSQGERRRRSSRIKKKESQNDPEIDFTSNDSFLNTTSPLPDVSKEKSKSKSKKNRNHELDQQPTAIADLTTANVEAAPPSPPSSSPSSPQPTIVENEGFKELDDKVLLNRTNEVCNESYPKFDEIDESIFFCKR